MPLFAMGVSFLLRAGRYSTFGCLARQLELPCLTRAGRGGVVLDRGCFLLQFQVSSCLFCYWVMLLSAACAIFVMRRCVPLSAASLANCRRRVTFACCCCEFVSRWATPGYFGGLAKPSSATG